MKAPRRALATALGVAALVTLPVAALVPHDAAPQPAPSASPAASAASASTAASRAPAPLRIEMRNVFLHVNATAGLHVRALRGEAASTTPGEVVLLDDPRTFSLKVSGGAVALGGDDLAALLNDFVFAYKGAPLSKIGVKVTDDGIVQTGVLHKGVDLRFTMHARLTLQPDGRILVHPTHMDILGVDGEKLLHALGLHLSNMLDLKGARGMAVRGDDLLMAPLAILPPPTVSGTLASVRTEAGYIVLDFARTADDASFPTTPVVPDARNFVHFRGGHLRFGRLEMHDTDLFIRDADERDAFDLWLDHYAEQLAAGYSRNTRDGALRVVMPDYRALGRGSVSVPGVPGVPVRDTSGGR